MSGLGSNAAQEIQIGVGTLAGSTIMLLTIPWAISTFEGARDMNSEGKAASDPVTHKPKFDNGLTLYQSCVTTFENTPNGAKMYACVALLLLKMNVLV